MTRWLIALAALLGMLGAVRADGGRIVELPATASAHLPGARATVWLPPGYDASARRYGVLYMHDGQNLFDPAKSGFNKVWAADRSVARLAAAGRIDPVIIVGVWSPRERGRYLFPASLHRGMTAEQRVMIDQALGGAPRSDDYLRFLVDELKPAIDHDYRTLPSPANTTVAGSSMGGLISLEAIARRPHVFGRAACVSTHWPLSNPEATAPYRAQIEAAWRDYLGRELGRPRGRRIWFDHGDQTLDAAYAPYQAVVNARLTELGWRDGRDFASRAYPGAAHEEHSWAARLDDVLGWLLAR